jgi:hypothetical protein
MSALKTASTASTPIALKKSRADARLSDAAATPFVGATSVAMLFHHETEGIAVEAAPTVAAAYFATTRTISRHLFE